MNKDTQKIKPARDIARAEACKKIALEFSRSMDWAYKVSRRDPLVQDGEHYKDAVEAYEAYYAEIKKVIS